MRQMSNFCTKICQLVHLKRKHKFVREGLPYFNEAPTFLFKYFIILMDISIVKIIVNIKNGVFNHNCAQLYFIITCKMTLT